MINTFHISERFQIPGQRHALKGIFKVSKATIAQKKTFDPRAVRYHFSKSPFDLTKLHLLGSLLKGSPKYLKLSIIYLSDSSKYDRDKCSTFHVRL